ncbi:unnamed protein product [Mesocestoides corti]|nr:unnamed protein product [Mesocestoides corti]
MTTPVASSLTLFYGTRANFGTRFPITNQHQITTFVSLTTFLILVVTATTNNYRPFLENYLFFISESFLSALTKVTAETFMNFTFNEIAKTKRKQRQQRESSEYRSPPIVATVSALVTNQSPSSQIDKLSVALRSSPMAQDASIRQSIANMTERTHIRFNGQKIKMPVDFLLNTGTFG